MNVKLFNCTFTFHKTVRQYLREGDSFHVSSHGSLSAVTHAHFRASVVRPASQAGPVHESAGVGEVS